MRSWTVPALLAALLSAAAAQACFFKCFSRPAASPDYRSVYAGTPYLRIVSVDGHTIDMNGDPNVQGEVNSAHDVEVVVSADYDTGVHSDRIDLVLTDLGPRVGAAVAPQAGGKKHHAYKWEARIERADGGPGIRTAGAATRFWEIHFTLPYMPTAELTTFNKYKLQAYYPSETSPTVQSDPVTFWTSH